MNKKDKINIGVEAFLDIAGVMFVALDDNGNIELINKKGCQILDYPENELTGSNWFDLCIPSRIRTDVKRIYKQLMEGKIQPFKHYENPVVTRGDVEKIIAWHNTILYDEEGNIKGTLSSGEDVTDKLAAEKALRDSEQRYRTLLEGAAVGILVADLETKDFVFANKAICQMLGFSQNELIGMNVRDIHPLEAMNEVAAEFEAQARGEKITVFGLPCLNKHGDIIYCNISTKSIMFQGKLCNQGIFTNVTEQKKIKQALIESEQNFKDLADNSPDATVILDEDEKIIFANKHTADMTGYRIDELIGSSCWELVGSDEVTEFKKQMRKVIEFEGDPQLYEHTLLRKDKTTLVAEMSLTATIWETVVCPLITIRDITVRKQMEIELSKARQDWENIFQAIGQPTFHRS